MDGITREINKEDILGYAINTIYENLQYDDDDFINDFNLDNFEVSHDNDNIIVNCGNGGSYKIIISIEEAK